MILVIIMHFRDHFKRSHQLPRYAISVTKGVGDRNGIWNIAGKTDEHIALKKVLNFPHKVCAHTGLNVLDSTFFVPLV